MPDRARLIAVTRIESPKPKATSLTRDSMQAVAEAITASSRLPLVAAVQIDFDATESQRPLYLTLLADVRQGLGDAVPLSMTALVSWCVHDRWLDRAPVDEIVPMLFRMGPDDGRLRAAATSTTSLDPRCTRAVGVSLDEPIRVVRHHRRVYAFSPRSWTSADVGAIEVRE